MKVHDFEAKRQKMQEEKEKDAITPAAALKLYLEDSGFLQDKDAQFIVLVDTREGSQMFTTHPFVSDALLEIEKAKTKLMQAILDGAFDG